MDAPYRRQESLFVLLVSEKKADRVLFHQNAFGFAEGFEILIRIRANLRGFGILFGEGFGLTDRKMAFMDQRDDPLNLVIAQRGDGFGVAVSEVALAQFC